MSSASGVRASRHVCCHGVAVVGLQGHPVRIECVRSPGLPGLRIVGLPGTAVREAEDRIRTAIGASGWKWPGDRIVVNLAPADLPKLGTGFDTPLALAILAASGQLPTEALDGVWAFGEVSLDGTLRTPRGHIAAARAAQQAGARRLIVAHQGAAEAAYAVELDVVGSASLKETFALLTGRQPPRSMPQVVFDDPRPCPDLSDVRGQSVARRALEIAAAGGHHLLLMGPPGCGKSLLAQRLAGLLPPLTARQAVDVTEIETIAGRRGVGEGLRRDPPVRAPHHSVTAAALLGGGGGIPRPGDVTLAHHGVLVLDEMLEVPRTVLDALRQPLEERAVVLSRSGSQVTFPAAFQLVATTNGCPCGMVDDPFGTCRCTPSAVQRYQARLSGPLLDRFDLQILVRRPDVAALTRMAPSESSAAVADRVVNARAVAHKRWSSRGIEADRNAAVSLPVLREHVRPVVVDRAVGVLDQLGLSSRAFAGCLSVARTIADLAGRDEVDIEHVDEAVGYRFVGFGGSRPMAGRS